MILQDKILNDLKQTKDKEIKSALKVIIGELQRQPTKVLSDDQVVSILKKLKKYEDERLSKYTKVETTPYLETLKKYLPTQVSREEILDWIHNSAEFDAAKNMNQAIGLVCKHFGKSVDGNLVKEIVKNSQ